MIQEIREHLEENVLVFSSTGEAGIGTTAVARSLAQSTADNYPDGCIFINLRSSGSLGSEPLTPVQVQRRVLCDLHTGPDAPELPEDPLALRRMYQAILSERRVLLVLDDAMSAAQLRYLLPRPNSTAIVTTQYDLASHYPKLFTRGVEGLHPEDAYRLIGQVAPAALTLSMRGMAPLAARLGGIPLALRIVAPLLGKTPPLLLPGRLLDSLDIAQKRISALQGPGFSNRIVLTAIEVAYEMLDLELKPYFEGLGVFSAPFTTRAAATVWNVSPERAEQVLTQLAARALVDHAPHSSYYELHHLIQLYAQELLLSQPDRARELVSRYVEHVMREVIQASADLQVVNPEHEPPALDLYTLWEHLPAAWNRAIGRDLGWPQPETMDRWVCDFPLQSKSWLRQTLSREEYGVWLASALEAAEALRDSRIVALHLGELGRLSIESGDDRAALSYFERQADAARDARMPALEGEAHLDAGVTCGALGNVKAAEEHWQRAVVLFQQSQDPRISRLRAWLRELRNRSSTNP